MGGKIRYTKEQLLDLLKKKADELGHAPTSKEIDSDKKMPRSRTYFTQFGSYSNAITAIGLEPNYKARKKLKRYTKEELLKRLKEKAEELGRAPMGKEVDADDDMPSRHSYINAFGSYNKAIESIGSEINRKSRYTVEELVEALKRKAEELGKTPTTIDMTADEDMPDVRTYHTFFGSWNKSLEAAGLLLNMKRHGLHTNEEFIETLKKKAEELGRTPTTKEINADKEMPSARTYYERFGSLTDAFKAAGLEPNYEPRKTYTKKKLIDALKKKAEELSKTPSVSEINADKDMPDAKTYIRKFGSYTAGLEAAELKPNKPWNRKRPLKKRLLDERL